MDSSTAGLVPLLRAILIMATAMAVGMLVLTLTTPDKGGAVLYLVCAALCGGCWFLVERGRTHLATIAFSCGLWVIAVANSALFGVLSTPVLIHMIVVLVAGLFWHPRASLGFALASAAAFLVLFWAEGQPWHPAPLPSDVIRAYFATVLTLLLGAVLVQLAFGATRDALEEAGQARAAAVQAAETLASRERELAGLVSGAPDALVLVDEAGLVQAANAAARTLFADMLPNGTPLVGFGLPALGSGLVEGELVRPDGKTIPVEVRVRAEGTDGGRHLTVRDLTDRRRAEVLDEELRSARRLEAMGRLSGGVAHDFNNLLMVIDGNLGLLQDRFRGDAEVAPLLDDALSASARARGITAGLLAAGRRQVMIPEALQLNAAITMLLPLLKRMSGRLVTVQTDFDEPLPPISFDRSKFEQVMINLVTNAAEAMPTGGTLTLRTRGATVAERAWVQLDVIDTGTGIAPEVRRSLFEPFITTRERGTGLGLATVYGIMVQSGGTVSVTESSAQGTCFRLRLPAGADARAPTPMPAPHDGVATVLLVDDEPAVRTAVAKILESGGHQVVQAADAYEAEALLAQHGVRVALLVTDVVLPGKTGVQLAEQAVANHPSLPVLFVSGYAPDLDGHPLLLSGRASFLTKPFRPDALRLAVERALGSKETP